MSAVAILRQPRKNWGIRKQKNGSNSGMEFSCQVCLSRYDSEAHRPLLLPACGHSFCAFCVQALGQQGKTYCPKCRKEKAVQPISTLPVNYSLLEIVQSTSLGAAAEEPPEPPSRPTGGRIDGKMPPRFRHTQGYLSFPAPAKSTVQAHNPNSSKAGPERELQDELDFQMAIHLTFCKDWHHDVNQHDSCPVWRQEKEDNEDVASVLTFMQEI